MAEGKRYGMMISSGPIVLKRSSSRTREHPAYQSVHAEAVKDSMYFRSVRRVINQEQGTKRERSERGGSLSYRVISPWFPVKLVANSKEKRTEPLGRVGRHHLSD